MHNHSNSRMMWMMVLGCLLPLALIFILGGTGLGKNWVWLLALVLMFGMHAMMMSGHKHSDEDTGDKGAGDVQPSAKTAPDNHQHH